MSDHDENETFECDHCHRLRHFDRLAAERGVKLYCEECAPDGVAPSAEAPYPKDAR